MILTQGFFAPSKKQIVEVRKNADESFCQISTKEFMKPFPSFEGWQCAEESATLLALKNVEPHDDPWVSRGREPRVRRALFWLLDGGQTFNGEGVFFGCGRESVRIKPGEFVVFNDTLKHWVMSNKKWFGAAIQLSKIN